MSNPILEAAIDYADRGWHVVPLRPKSKIPWLKEWPVNATNDSDQVIEWWNGRPQSNVGIQLGPRSGIIDIEGDEANSEKEILELFGGEIPQCPTFKSARSTHRLFRWYEQLPHGAKLDIGAVEIRMGNHSKGAQTVFPPSIHESGMQYHWVEGLTPDDVDVPDVPEAARTAIWNMGSEDTMAAPEPGVQPAWRELYDSKGVSEGRRDVSLFSAACKHAARTPNIEDSQEQADLFRTIASLNSTQCKPPLPDADVQRIHRQAISYTRRDAKSESKANVALTEMGLAHENGLWAPGSWRLTTVLSDPPEFRLHVPQWEERTSDGRGIVPLSLEEIQDAAKVASKVLLITRNVVLADTPRKWPGIWHGEPGSAKNKRPPTRGLMAQLIDASQHEKAPGVDKRYVVVAELFQEIVVDRARSPRGDDDKPDPRRVTLRADGTIWFRWMEIWKEPMRDRLLTVAEKGELKRKLEIVGADFQFFPQSAPGRRSYCVLKPSHISRLMAIIDSGAKGSKISKVLV